MFSFDRLDALCKQYGVSKSHLCRLVNKGNNYIQDSKKKQISIPMDIVCTWATALHTTPEYLLGETDDQTKKEISVTDDDDLIAIVQSLSKDDQEFLRSFIKRMKSYQDGLQG